MARAGFGLDFRIKPKFGMHPELTYLRYFDAGSQPAASWFLFGLGFNFGALPDLGPGAAGN